MSTESKINNENNQREYFDDSNSRSGAENSFKITPLKESKQMNLSKQHLGLPLSTRESATNAGLNSISSSYMNTKPSAAQSPESQRLSFLQQKQISQHQTSPLNQSFLFNNSINTSNNMNISPQVERSNRLTTELESLVNDLDVIYNEIGLSPKEIQQKEADIFRNLSDTIRSFSVKAQQEKQSISKQNIQILDCLKTILYKIGDSKGTYTINDLYIRNMIILSQHDMSPSKRDMSLLNKRRILMQGAEFVFEVFDKILKEYLADCIEFIELKTLNNGIKSTNFEEYDHLKLLTAAECEELKELLNDSNKLSKCFFDNIFNKSSFPYKILNQTDLQCYNHLNYNKANLVDKKENKLKQLISEIHMDYLHKKEILIPNLKEISMCCNFLGLNIPQDLSKFDISKLDTYETSVTNYLNNIPSLNDKIPIDDYFLEVVSNLLISVSQYKLERMQLNYDLTTQVRSLWNKLKVEQFEIETFESKLVTDFSLQNSTLPVSQINILTDELNRLKILRKASIKQIIEEDWERINELWNVMRFPLSEREPFQKIYESKKKEITIKEEQGNKISVLYEENELLLNRCEDEIQILEEKHKLFQPLLKNIDLYETFLNEKLELEESSKNPGRLTSRDSHKILLREEKIRKRISRYFPSVVNNLAKQLQDFQDNFQRFFLKDTGEDYLEIILKEKESLALKYPRSRVAMMQHHHMQQTSKSIKREAETNGTKPQHIIHRPPSAQNYNSNRERYKKILNNAARPQTVGSYGKKQPLHSESTPFDQKITGPRRSDNKFILPKTESLPHSRISSRTSTSSLLESRITSRTISNKSETSVKRESDDLNFIDSRPVKEASADTTKALNKLISPNRLFKRYERNSSILKRPLSAENIDPNEYKFKKVRISSDRKNPSRVNESLSPINPTALTVSNISHLNKSSLQINASIDDDDRGIQNNSLIDDVDMAEDVKFDLWQQQQLAKIGSTLESQEKDKNSGTEPSDALLGINDTSNF